MISVFLFLIPGLLGLLLLLKGWKVGPLTKGDRVKVAIIGSLAILAWAGYLIGPILAIVSALLPERIGMWPSRQKIPKSSTASRNRDMAMAVGIVITIPALAMSLRLTFLVA